MKQLEFEFDLTNYSEYYVSHEVIDEGKNPIFCWSDTLSDDGKKLTYHEYVYNTPDYMEFENWIDIENKWLNKSAFEYFSNYLKKIKRNQDRLKKLKRFLESLKIPFKEGDWQTIDRDLMNERNHNTTLN